MQIDMTYVRFYRSHFGSLDTLYMKGDDKGEFVIMPQYEHSPNTFILATDYETYALEYSCEVSMLFGPIEMANIMCKSTFYHEIVCKLYYFTGHIIVVPHVMVRGKTSCFKASFLEAHFSIFNLSQ